MTRILFFIFSILALSTSFSQTESVESKIKEMINVLGSTERMKTVADNIISIQEKQNPILIESEYWKEFKLNIYETGLEDLIDSLIPIYKKHLNIKEIESITEFYSSEAGQAMVKKFPLISTESMEAGMAWGEQISQKISQEVKASKEKKFSSPISDCNEFKIGRFKYYDYQNNLINLQREKDFQIETVNGNIYKSKISWIGDCKYKVWDFQDDNDYSDIKPLIITIYESDAKGYKYIYKQEGEDQYYLGEILLTE